MPTQPTTSTQTPNLPSTITSSSLQQTSPITLPPPPPVNTGASAYASIPNPISPVQNVVQQNQQPTATENQQSDLLQRLAQATGQSQSLATYQYAQENNAGIPALTKTVNDLNVQLQGLNDQASTLQLAASPGGTINNQMQQQAAGRGITTAGLAPLTASALRANQIQQAGIASQALTVKSALFAAQGNLTLAKDAADKAAQVQFDAQEQQIKYQQSLLAAIQPQLSRDEAARAATLQAQLADRTRQIEYQREDFKTGQAAIADALKNNPDNAQAQQAATMAAKLDPNDPQYLQKVQQLVAPYASDVTLRALDLQAKRGQITLQQGQIAQLPLEAALKRAQISNANLDYKIKSQQLGSNAPDLTQLPPQQQAQLKSSGFLNYNPEVQSLAQQVVNGNLPPSELSKRSSGASPYNKILAAADAYSMATTGKHFNIGIAQRNFNFANNPQTQNTLNYLSSLVGTNDGTGNLKGGNLDQVIQLSNQRFQGVTNPFNPLAGKPSLPPLNDAAQWVRLQAGDPKLAAYYAALTETADQVAKILQGGGTGSGTSDAKLNQAQALFQHGFTPDQISAVAGTMKTLLANRGKEIVRDNPYLSDYANALGYGNKSQQSSAGISQSDGTVWQQNPDGTYTRIK